MTNEEIEQMNLLYDNQHYAALGHKFNIHRTYYKEPNEDSSQNLCYSVNGDILGYMEIDESFYYRITQYMNELNKLQEKNDEV